MNDRVDALIKPRANLRPAAEQIWTNLNATTPLQSDSFLQLHAYSVSVKAIESQSTSKPLVYTASSAIQLLMRPELFIGTKSGGDQSSLSGFNEGLTGKNGFELNIDSTISFNQANDMVRSRFPVVFKYHEHQLTLYNPVLRQYGRQVLSELDLYSGVTDTVQPVTDLWSALRFFFGSIYNAINGRLWTGRAKAYLSGTPTFDASRRDVLSPDLDYIVETRDFLFSSLDWLAHAPLIEYLRVKTQLDFGNELDNLYPAINGAINRPSGDVLLSGYTNNVRPEVVYATDAGITIRIRAIGEMLLTILTPTFWAFRGFVLTQAANG